MRWADMDLLGHVNNVVYVDYLQEARVDMLRTHGPAARTGELAEGVVVVRHEVTYLAPLSYRFRPVKIECWVTEVRAASFTMAYEIFQDDPEDEGGRRVYLRATTLLTPYVFATERPRRLNDVERETLQAFLEPLGAGTAGPPRCRPPGRGRSLPGARPVLRRRRLRPRQQREVLRVLPGGPHPADRAAVAGPARGDPGNQHGGRADRRGLQGADPVPPQPYDAWSWISRVGSRSATIESVICDGDTVLSQARVAIVFFDQETQRSAPPPEVYRERLLTALV